MFFTVTCGTMIREDLCQSESFIPLRSEKPLASFREKEYNQYTAV